MRKTIIFKQGNPESFCYADPFPEKRGLPRIEFDLPSFEDRVKALFLPCIDDVAERGRQRLLSMPELSKGIEFIRAARRIEFDYDYEQVEEYCMLATLFCDKFTSAENCKFASIEENLHDPEGFFVGMMSGYGMLQAKKWFFPFVKQISAQLAEPVDMLMSTFANADGITDKVVVAVNAGRDIGTAILHCSNDLYPEAWLLQSRFEEDNDALIVRDNVVYPGPLDRDHVVINGPKTTTSYAAVCTQLLEDVEAESYIQRAVVLGRMFPRQIAVRMDSARKFDLRFPTSLKHRQMSFTSSDDREIFMTYFLHRPILFHSASGDFHTIRTIVKTYGDDVSVIMLEPEKIETPNNVDPEFLGRRYLYYVATGVLQNCSDIIAFPGESFVLPAFIGRYVATETSDDSATLLQYHLLKRYGMVNSPHKEGVFYEMLQLASREIPASAIANVLAPMFIREYDVTVGFNAEHNLSKPYAMSRNGQPVMLSQSLLEIANFCDFRRQGLPALIVIDRPFADSIVSAPIFCPKPLSASSQFPPSSYTMVSHAMMASDVMVKKQRDMINVILAGMKVIPIPVMAGPVGSDDPPPLLEPGAS